MSNYINNMADEISFCNESKDEFINICRNSSSISDLREKIIELNRGFDSNLFCGQSTDLLVTILDQILQDIENNKPLNESYCYKFPNQVQEEINRLYLNSIQDIDDEENIIVP